jgi:hypothetical protein
MESKQEELVLVDRQANYVSYLLLDTEYVKVILDLFLVDHGLDSFSTVPFTITIFSVFGQGAFR